MRRRYDQRGDCEEPTRRHSGREPCAYDLTDPGDLPGLHADNMIAGLAPREELRYVLYSPIWDGKSAPFGIIADPASHALAVASDRFVISRDFHVAGTPLELRTIPFSEVLYVQLGSSFCLGWFAVLFAEGSELAFEAMLSPAIGRDHFADAAREYRSAVAKCLRKDPPGPGLAWDDVCGQDRLQAAWIREMIVRGERPICALHSRELWVEHRSFWKKKWRCVSPEGLLLATDYGILCVTRETYERPVTWNIGMNVICVPAEAVGSVAICRQALLSRGVPRIQLHLARHGISTCLDVPFDEAEGGAAQAFVKHLAIGESPGNDRQAQARCADLMLYAQRCEHE